MRPVPGESSSSRARRRTRRPGMRRSSTRFARPATSAPSSATGASCRPIPAALRAEIAARELQLIGAFVPVALVNPDAHAAGIGDRDPHRAAAARRRRRERLHRARRRQRAGPRARAACRTNHAGDGPERRAVGNVRRRRQSDRARRARGDRAAHRVPPALRRLRRDARRDRGADGAAPTRRSSACASTPAIRSTAAAIRSPSSNEHARARLARALQGLRPRGRTPRPRAGPRLSRRRPGAAVLASSAPAASTSPPSSPRSSGTATTAGSSSNRTCFPDTGHRPRARGATASTCSARDLSTVLAVSFQLPVIQFK